MHIQILGAGAIGCLWASRLQQKKSPDFKVSLITRSPQSDYLELHESLQSQSITQSIKQYHAKQLTNIDCVIVCVKSFQLQDALKSVQHAINSNTWCVLLQNGMGNIEIAQKFIALNNLIVGSNTHGSFIQHADSLNQQNSKHWVHAGVGKTLLGSTATPSMNADFLPYFSLMQRALPTVEWRKNIKDDLYRKLIANDLINPLTALYQCKNGELLTNTNYFNHWQSLLNEIMPLVRFWLPSDSKEQLSAFVSQIIATTSNNFSSMYQDSVNNQTSEIEQITGFIINQASLMEISLPIHQQLYRDFKSKYQ